MNDSGKATGFLSGFRNWFWPISNEDMTRKRLFYVFMKLFIIGFLVLGVGGIVGIYLSNSDAKVFKAVALGIVVLWACLFIGFFIWAVYYYHVNHGLTDSEIYRIDKVLQRTNPGDNPTKNLLRDTKNPYAGESFGLPRGTVRGTIAFTLLFGAIAMLVLSMGMDPELGENAFFWDHYEFYKTAFLMMIAFYFGSKSLETLQKRWPSVRQGSGGSSASGGASRNEIPDTFEEELTNRADITAEQRMHPSPTGLKQILQVAELEDVEILKEEKVAEHMGILEYDYPQIKDKKVGKYLSEDMIQSVADDINLDKNVLKAVIEVESAGRGFLPDGRPKILFEGHRFWHHLKHTVKSKKEPNKLILGNENILYPKWTRKYYLGGAREYERLNKARNIDREAANYATSWGLFQIMGENVLENLPGREKDIEKFVEAQYDSEYEHLLDFIDFIKNKKGKDAKGNMHPLIHFIRIDLKPEDIEWASFALGYNGPGYKRNNYDVRMKNAYKRFKDSDEEYA